MSKVYVVAARGDNGAEYIEDYAEFTINIAVFTSKDLAEAFLKYPPALEEACIKHDVIVADENVNFEKDANWIEDTDGNTILETDNGWFNFTVKFRIEEFELGEYEVKEEEHDG